MPYNGSGVFSRIYSWVTDAANGLYVDSTRMDTDTDDIATGLSTCMLKDGTQIITNNIPMAGYKFTGVGLGSGASDTAIISNANVLNMCEFRLTLTTGVPVTTTDVTGASAVTIYCSPYKGNRIALFDGSNWHMRTSAEFSIAIPAVTNAMYDVFCYDNATVPTLELLAWTNATTRATALALQDGVLSKTGALTRRYMGSVYVGPSSGQSADAVSGRWLWNYYNRVRRQMLVTDTTNTWNYTTATIRQANNSTANQLDFVVGWSEDVVTAEVNSTCFNTNVGVVVSVGVGLDSSSTFASGGLQAAVATNVAAAAINPRGFWSGYPGVGRHNLMWNEYSTATGTTSWIGDNGGTITQSGIKGEIWG